MAAETTENIDGVTICHQRAEIPETTDESSRIIRLGAVRGMNKRCV